MIEFWLGTEEMINTVPSSFAPMVGDLVSIKGVTYEVTFRNFAFDYSDEYDAAHMRCVVRFKKVSK
jgi:hypothetical protein